MDEELKPQAVPIEAPAREQHDHDRGKPEHPCGGERVGPDKTTPQPLDDDCERQDERVGQWSQGEPTTGGDPPAHRARTSRGHCGSGRRRIRGSFENRHVCRRQKPITGEPARCRA